MAWGSIRADARIDPRADVRILGLPLLCQVGVRGSGHHKLKVGHQYWAAARRWWTLGVRLEQGRAEFGPGNFSLQQRRAVGAVRLPEDLQLSFFALASWEEQLGLLSQEHPELGMAHEQMAALRAEYSRWVAGSLNRSAVVAAARDAPLGRALHVPSGGDLPDTRSLEHVQGLQPGDPLILSPQVVPRAGGEWHRVLTKLVELLRSSTVWFRARQGVALEAELRDGLHQAPFLELGLQVARAAGLPLADVMARSYGAGTLGVECFGQSHRVALLVLSDTLTVRHWKDHQDCSTDAAPRTGWVEQGVPVGTLMLLKPGAWQMLSAQPLGAAGFQKQVLLLLFHLGLGTESPKQRLRRKIFLHEHDAELKKYDTGSFGRSEGASRERKQSAGAARAAHRAATPRPLGPGCMLIPVPAQISEREKQLQEELMQAQEDLRQAEESLKLSEVQNKRLEAAEQSVRQQLEDAVEQRSKAAREAMKQSSAMAEELKRLKEQLEEKERAMRELQQSMGSSEEKKMEALAKRTAEWSEAPDRAVRGGEAEGAGATGGHLERWRKLERDLTERSKYERAELGQLGQPALDPAEATFQFIVTDLSGYSTGRGLLAQDARIMRVETVQPKAGMEELETNMTYVMTVNESFHLTGGSPKTIPLCRHLPFGPFGGKAVFQDLFAWVSDPMQSTYLGESVISKRPCSLWRRRGESGAPGATVLCAAGDVPVELNMSVSSNVTGEVKWFNSSYQFGAVSTRVPEELLETPSSCDLAPPCEPLDPDPVALDAYVFHPNLSAVDYNIEDQNVADLEGEALFICMDRLRFHKMAVDHNYTLISRYSLLVSPAYGQYPLCNGYPDTVPQGPRCVGGDGRLVGREAPFFAGDGESRCSTSSPVGFWLGVPSGGRCSAGQRPSRTAAQGGCTWSLEARRKTIRQTCLFHHNFFELCDADFAERRGFRRSAAALRRAFASDETARGGCADVGGPEVKEVEATVVV
ncbi:RING-type domain-containing protein [Durusdinium trenchii]|uniref:RING-type domain-containing protein n=1 Tax=Durusdinium trenchii TaxID=1381693 RepID=A0ABP0IVA8_9DINO